MRRVVLAVMGAAALCACTLLTSLDDLSEGSPDAGLQPSEAGPAESGSDTFVPDAAVGDADADAPPTPYCKTITGFTICADFDDTNSPPFPFDSIARSGDNNFVTYDPGDFRSPPNSLYLVGGEPSQLTSAGLIWRSDPITTEITVELDFRIVVRGTRPFDLIGYEKSGYQLNVEVAADGDLQFDTEMPDPDGGTISGTVPTSGKATGAWQHLKWVAKKDGSTTRFTNDVSLDNVAIGATNFAQNAYIGAGGTEVQIGDNALEASNPQWKVRIDNVVITTK